MQGSQPVQRFIGEVSIVKQKLFLQILLQKQILSQAQAEYQQSQNIHNQNDEETKKVLKIMQDKLQAIKVNLSQKQEEFKNICKIEFDSQVQLVRCTYSQQIAEKRLETFDQISKEIQKTKASIMEKNSKKNQNQKQFELKSNILQAIKENMGKESQLKKLTEQNQHFQNQLKTLQNQKINILEIKKQYERSVKQRNQTIKENIDSVARQKINIQIQIKSTQEKIKHKKQKTNQSVNDKTDLLQSIKKITEINKNRSQNRNEPERQFGRIQSQVRNNQQSHIFNNDGYAQLLEQEQNVESRKCQVQTKWSQQFSKKKYIILLLVIITGIILLKI